MDEKSNQPDDLSAREITASRTFDAPRELVFKVFGDRHHISQWWGPRGFRTTTESMDFRPGGTWRHVMHGPDGVDYPNEIVYDEIVENERIVYTHVSPPVFRSTFTFEKEGSAKTRVTVRMVFESAKLRDQVVKAHGAIEGLNQTLERLGEHMQELSSSIRELTLKRTFDAPRELIFKLWTDPAHVKEWWGPRGFTNPVCEIDVRPGGTINIHMRGPDGTTFPMSGQYKEIIRPEKLVFLSSALDVSGKPIFEILNTVTFEEIGGKTNLTLHTKIVSYTPIAPIYFSGQEIGWSQTLDRLAEQLVPVK